MCGITAIIGTILGATLGTVSLIDSYNQQESLNSAIEAAYEADMQNARNRYAQQQMQLQEETLQESTKTRQERREAQVESLHAEASAQAAMSSLNIAGNTASRNAVVNGTTTSRADATYASRQEGIEAEHLVRSLGINQEYEGAANYAARKAEASWRPIGGAWQNFLNIGSSALSGLSTGARLGSAGMDSAIDGTVSRLWRPAKIS